MNNRINYDCPPGVSAEHRLGCAERAIERCRKILLERLPAKKRDLLVEGTLLDICIALPRSKRKVLNDTEKDVPSVKYISYDLNTMVVWGVGDTIYGAFQEGMVYLNSWVKNHQDMNSVSFETSPATDRLILEIENRGGGELPPWGIGIDGVADLIGENDEEK